MKNLFKNISLLSFAALLLFTSACKKDKDTGATNCVLSSVQNTGSDTALIVYDAQGRVTSYGSAAYYRVDLTYTGGLTVTSTVTNPDTSQPFMNLFLNSDGNIQSMTRTVSISGGVYDYTYNLEYDAEGHIILSEQILHQQGSLNTTYYKDSLVYASGNLIAKYTFVKDNSNPYTLSEHHEITYTTDLNKAGFYIWSYDEEPISMLSGWQEFYHLFGNTSKNLPATTKDYDNTGTLFYQLNYSFLLNADGYPTEENISRTMLSPYTRNRTFGYSCN